MTRAHALDRLIGDSLPPLRNDAEQAAFEATARYEERIAAQSTFDALQLGAAIAPNAPALQFIASAASLEPAVTLSHAQFVARVMQAGNLFHAFGVGPQDVVSFLLPLLPQAYFGLFGAQVAGIANPVNPLLSPQQLAEILRAAQTKVLVTIGPRPGTDIWDKVQQIRAELPELKAVLVIGGQADAASGVHDFDAELAKQPADRIVSGRTIRSSDIAGYFHTGGTTGTPKLVRHTHANQVYQAWGLRLTLPTAGSNLLCGLPLFHVGGSLTQGLATLAGSGCIVTLTPAGWRDAGMVRNAWKLVERYRPTVFGGVPTVLAAALAVPVDGADISSVKLASGGGSAIPVAVGQAYQQMIGGPVLEVYGMTETASVHTMSWPGRPLRLGSVGHPLPYSRVRIVKVDADGTYQGDCATDEIGVVAMAGPGVFSGYVSDAHNRGAFVEPGWVNSGDLGRVDADGYLWITGRAKDLIIRGGHNIDPQAIEEVFYQHPAVALAALVSQPDAYAGELPVAYVQAKPGLHIDVNELLDFVRERTPERAAVPVKLYVIDAIPLTGVGKIFKPALRVDAAERMVRGVLADLAAGGVRLEVAVRSDATHGQVIQVTGEGASGAAREAVGQQVHERLGPLPWRHEVLWR
jgi:fatty-acyl-CoA synthase